MRVSILANLPVVTLNLAVTYFDLQDFGIIIGKARGKR